MSKKGLKTLHIQVTQNGVLQESFQCDSGTDLNIAIGDQLSPKKDKLILIPYCSFRHNLFEVKNNEIIHKIKNIEHGFVNSVEKFGGYEDFLFPNGSLASQGDYADPLMLPLPVGSRGSLSIESYRILFKVTRKTAAPKNKIEGCNHNAMRISMNKNESTACVFAALAASLLLFPMGLSLLNRTVALPSLDNLPPSYFNSWISGDHYRFQNLIFPTQAVGNDDHESSHQLALHWVSNLQTRWESALLGIPNVSDIEYLTDHEVTGIEKQDGLKETHNILSELQKQKKSGKYFLTTATQLVTQDAPLVRSTYFTNVMLNHLDKTYTALSTLNTAYGNQKSSYVSLPKNGDGKTTALMPNSLIWARSLATGSSYFATKPNSLEGIGKNISFLSGLETPPPPPQRQPRIDTANVIKAIGKRHEEVQLCYDIALDRVQTLKGDVTLRWTINTKGRAGNVQVVSDLIQSEKLVTCLKSKIRTWAFPRAEHGDVTFEFPFKIKR